MNDPSDSVKALSRASRHVDRAAQALAVSGIPGRRRLVETLAGVLNTVRQAHAELVAADPDLDYHEYRDDSERGPTSRMQQVMALREVSEAALGAG